MVKMTPCQIHVELGRERGLALELLRENLELTDFSLLPWGFLMHEDPVKASNVGKPQNVNQNNNNNNNNNY